MDAPLVVGGRVDRLLVGSDGVAVPQARLDLAIYGSRVKVQICHQVTG